MTTRHRLRTFLTLLVAALVLAACGGTGPASESTGTTAASTGTTAASSGAPTLTPAQLATALLTSADLGAGWSETRSVGTVPQTQSAALTPVTSPTTSTTLPNGTMQCPAAAELAPNFEVVGNEPQAAVMLYAPDFTAERPVAITEGLWSLTTAASLLHEAKAVLSTCTGQTWTNVYGERVSMSALSSLPKIGDESYTVLRTIVTPGTNVEWWAPTVVARFGNVVMLLTGNDVHRTTVAPTLTIATIADATRIAADRLETLTAGV